VEVEPVVDGLRRDGRSPRPSDVEDVRKSAPMLTEIVAVTA
jgi:hypothetical protein